MPKPRQRTRRISLDTETTGLDFVRGVQPFLITTCSEDGLIQFWEWDVDPLTRRPEIPQEEDKRAIVELLDSADLIYLHNSKYDARALATIDIQLPWHKVRDSFVAGHLLASNHLHDLTSMCIEYLGEDISKYEDDVKGVVTTCRAICKKERREWKIAKEGDPDMPSIKKSSKRDEDKPWKADMWLPRALIKAGCTQYIPEHWSSVCSAYANADSEHTLVLGLEVEKLIRERGYWPHYMHRLQLMQVACEMESYGLTARGDYTESNIRTYEQSSAEASAELKCIAADYGHDLELAAGAALNDNMRDFFYGSIKQRCPHCEYEKRIKHWNGEPIPPSQAKPGEAELGEGCPKCARKGTLYRQSRYSQMVIDRQPNLDLPVIESVKTGNASLDKNAMQEYLTTLEGPALDFMRILTDKRKRDTDLSYMLSYQRFWVPVKGAHGYFRIHPFLNPFSTAHLRWTSYGPNLQNIGGQEDKCDECDGYGCDLCSGTGKSRVSVKHCFGPALGREWYSADYRSIERRIPPYECGEEKMIEVFERPNEPPYWGNLYCLTASILYADEYWPLINDEGRFRKEYPRLYKKAKFFDLAKQYGAGRRKGDLLSGISNSYDLVDNEFPKLSALQKSVLREAEKTGWIYTIPSRAIDPDRGYPLLASRTEDNYVLSTTPFNYHTSGTACECKNLGLLRCAQRCAEWRLEGFDAYIPLEVHDELLFDFPRGPKEDSNLWRAKELQALMEQSGEDLIPRIPTPVKLEYHSQTWAEGRPI